MDQPTDLPHLGQHVETDLPADWWPCPTCGAVLDSIDNLTRHWKHECRVRS